jgi:hypothetical protein
MIRCLRIARSTAMRVRTQTINAIKALLVTDSESQRGGRNPARVTATRRRTTAFER